MNGKIAGYAWANRPRFVVHPGDLVDTGSVKEQWVDEFFGSMRPLFERVALFPVLGNHEQDARFFYDYMSLPDPEYYYTFEYGNAQFFMLDSNRRSVRKRNSTRGSRSNYRGARRRGSSSSTTTLPTPRMRMTMGTHGQARRPAATYASENSSRSSTATTSTSFGTGTFTRTNARGPCAMGRRVPAMTARSTW